jgi:twitching motility protein PilT
MNPDPLSWINTLCLACREHGASDLFLTVGERPCFRLHGQIIPASENPLSAEDFDPFWIHCGAGPETLDLDATFSDSSGGRFRVNLFRRLGQPAAVLRQIKTEIPALETLGVPTELIQTWARQKSGLVLVCGPSGMGKSTTVAATIEWVNQNFSKHVVTIEDPVEFLYQPRQCLFSQREVGIDTPSFASGLKQSLRQSPDLIMLGEIRDATTAKTALEAAETGHLVIATLHASTVPEALERLVRLFPHEDRDGVNLTLGSLLTGILCQRLIPNTEGASVLACEHFDNQGLSRKLILENKWKELADLIGRTDNPNNSSLVWSLVRLCKEGVITQETAMKQLANPQDFQRAMRGIGGSGGNYSGSA